MSVRLGILSTLALIGATAISSAQTSARSTQTDARWYAFLGCWASDTTGGHAAHAGADCIVPVKGSAGVEALSVINGKIVSRHRIDATGRTQPVDNQGCAGTQLATWSPNGQRVYMRSDYKCSTGIAGTSESMFALAPNGELLQIEDVRGGSSTNGVVNVDRRRDAGIAPGLPTDAAAAIESRQLSIETSRAAAARPLTTEDIVEALHNVDAPVVRNWIYETGQRFNLSGPQINALASADVPATVLQAMMGNSPAQQVTADGAAPNGMSEYGGSANTAPYQPDVYQPAMTQPTYTQYPYSEYNAYSGGYYYPEPLYYPMYYYPVPAYQRPLHYEPRTRQEPLVGVHAPTAGGYPHTAPYRPRGQATQPVNKTPARYRP